MTIVESRVRGRGATVANLDARPLTCSIGAEVHGVDLGEVSATTPCSPN